MNIITIFALAIGLAMDAFSVSICKGLSFQKMSMKKAVIIGIWFGGFQGLMPLIGYGLGVQFNEKITSIDHWIAFGLLLFIGINMIRESFSKSEDKKEDSISCKHMLLLAIATSIDALAVGVTFAFLEVHIITAVMTIGLTTFVLTVIGVKVGNVFGIKYKSKAELLGGVILVLLGIKILIEHTVL